MTFREACGIFSVNCGESGRHGKGVTKVQRTGLRYERKVEENLTSIVKYLGQNARVDFQLPLHFVDSNGPGTAIVDFLFRYENVIIVGETKLTWVEEAQEKLTKLYIPLMTHLLSSVEIRGLIICKNLIPGVEFATPILHSLSALTKPQIASIFTFPWRGQRPMQWDVHM